MEDNTSVLLKKYKETKDIKIRDEIFFKNCKLIEYVYNLSFKNDIYIKKDILSYGQIGLFKAIESFDTLKGYSFSSYAIKGIYYEIHHNIYKLYGFGSNDLSYSIEDIKNKSNVEDYDSIDEMIINILKKYYMNIDNYDKNIEERTYYKMAKEAVRFLLDPKSIEIMKEQEYLNPVSNYYYEIDEIIDTNFENQIDAEIIEIFLGLLSDEERNMFCLKYGLGCKQLTRNEIMKKYNIDRSELKRIEARCMFRFRKSVNLRNFSNNQIKYLKRKFNI